jgi:hypothetical protein
MYKTRGTKVFVGTLTTVVLALLVGLRGWQFGVLLLVSAGAGFLGYAILKKAIVGPVAFMLVATVYLRGRLISSAISAWRYDAGRRFAMKNSWRRRYLQVRRLLNAMF